MRVEYGARCGSSRGVWPANDLGSSGSDGRVIRAYDGGYLEETYTEVHHHSPLLQQVTADDGIGRGFQALPPAGGFP